MKNIPIAIGIFICISLSAYKIYSTFFADKPLAEVGECVVFHDDKLGRVQLKINKNYEKEDASDITFSVDTQFGRYQERLLVKNSEVRELGYEKAECL